MTQNDATNGATGSPGQENGGKSKPSPTILEADYERTSAVIAQLVDVRFKLVAFVPILTGAGVALITQAALESRWDEALLAVGGLCFVLAVMAYDLRNTAHYNSAVGRAKELEESLELQVFEGDSRRGVFGSRTDTNRNLTWQKRATFLRFPVRHAPALALVYATACAVWVWALGHSAFSDRSWDTDYIAPVLAVLAGLLVFARHTQIDNDGSEDARILRAVLRAQERGEQPTKPGSAPTEPERQNQSPMDALKAELDRGDKKFKALVVYRRARMTEPDEPKQRKINKAVRRYTKRHRIEREAWEALDHPQIRPPPGKTDQ